MSKLIFPLIIALVMATSIMVTPLFFLPVPTRQATGGTVAPGYADEKSQQGSSPVTTQTIRPAELNIVPSLSNILYMFVTCILIALATTLIVVRTRRIVP